MNRKQAAKTSIAMQKKLPQTMFKIYQQNKNKTGKILYFIRTILHEQWRMELLGKKQQNKNRASLNYQTQFFHSTAVT